MATYAYTRVSTDQQSTDAQRMEIEKLSGRKVDEYFCENISGSIRCIDRPEFKRMFDQLKQGDVVIVLKVDRLSRDMSDVHLILKTLIEEKKVGVVILQIGADIIQRGIMANLLISILAAWAQGERELISERTTAGLAAKKAKGVILGRPLSISKAKILKLQRLYKEEGYTQQMLSERFNISAKTIGKLLKMSPEEIEERENLREKQKRQIRDNK